jgi:uncharacterized protein YeaO (DUF488 family)
MDIQVKRIQDPVDPADGLRVLVDRLWPRGVAKAQAPWDLWLKDVAPSTELRRWFGHDPARWEDFQRRYGAELRGSAAFAQLQSLARSGGRLTLLYSARDRERNQAVALARWLQASDSA